MKPFVAMAMAITTLLAAPVWSQDREIGYDRGGLYEGLLADHSTGPSPGAIRLERRLGALPPVNRPLAAAPPAGHANPHIHTPPMITLVEMAKKAHH